MSEEFPLSGGATADGVVRVGDTVRKAAASRLEADSRRPSHLERAGFDAAPRWLGIDEQGRDVLSWIDGETFTDRGRMHPYIGDPPGNASALELASAIVGKGVTRTHALEALVIASFLRGLSVRDVEAALEEALDGPLVSKSTTEEVIAA